MLFPAGHRGAANPPIPVQAGLPGSGANGPDRLRKAAGGQRSCAGPGRVTVN